MTTVMNEPTEAPNARGEPDQEGGGHRWAAGDGPAKRTQTASSGLPIPRMGALGEGLPATAGAGRYMMDHGAWGQRHPDRGNSIGSVNTRDLFARTGGQRAIGFRRTPVEMPTEPGDSPLPVGCRDPRQRRILAVLRRVVWTAPRPDPAPNGGSARAAGDEPPRAPGPRTKARLGELLGVFATRSDLSEQLLGPRCWSSRARGGGWAKSWSSWACSASATSSRRWPSSSVSRSSTCARSCRKWPRSTDCPSRWCGPSRYCRSRVAGRTRCSSRSRSSPPRAGRPLGSRGGHARPLVARTSRRHRAGDRPVLRAPWPISIGSPSSYDTEGDGARCDHERLAHHRRQRAGRPGRHPHHHAGGPFARVRHPHRAAGRPGAGAVPRRRRAASTRRPCRRHRPGARQPHQDHGGHEHRRAPPSAGRPVRDRPSTAAASTSACRDDVDDLGREGRAPAARQEPLAARARAARHARRDARRVLAGSSTPRSAW